MDEVFAAILLGLLFAPATFGMIEFFKDNRNFQKEIVEVCAKRGYVQDDNTRVFCQVEVKK
jgi:hypothetical protein